MQTCFVYYESLKRALKTKTIYGYRCDERLKTSFLFSLFFHSRCEMEGILDLHEALSALVFFGVHARRVDSSTLVFSLSSHRYPYIVFVFSVRFNDS